ncbi:pirin family protein [Brevibacillus sp. B_LB10_24]|uniref:pirin family protein n=1 Tax=Brevibacillus sp. B_LB10_24 TaxID=3380645 RepID=UPI0038B8DA12
MNIAVHPRAEQGIGAFDGGKITEQKPIGFSGEGSSVKRIGPLFYWAWAKAKEEGYIDSHPHQAFEILTYVINGQAHHGDSLGTKSVVGAGGVQLIQAGSGVYHNERLVGPDCELFQIWFEPPVREALRRDPAYGQYEHEEFPVVEKDGVLVKTVIGEGAPLQLVADARMWDIRLAPGAVYERTIEKNRTVSGLAIRGSGTCSWETGRTVDFQQTDYIVIQADASESLAIKATADEPLWLTIVEVPTEVDYPLYPKR